MGENQDFSKIKGNLDIGLVINGKATYVKMPFIPKPKDVIEIGTSRYVVLDVEYKERQDKSCIPYVHIKKES